MRSDQAHSKSASMAGSDMPAFNPLFDRLKVSALSHEGCVTGGTWLFVLCGMLC